jgi:hypothetical protein
MNARPAKNSERGAVIVMVAVWLPVLAIFASFAIDVGHFFDYSRNLQNRADAFALAAGLEYGNTCATATPDATAMAAIGKAGQLYSGPGSASDLPYPYSTWPAAQYKNIPNLTAGSLEHYHVVVNGSGPWHQGQTSNGNWPGHTGSTASFTHGTLCAASYPDDQSGATGPIADVWVTQDNLPLFFPLFGFHPSISAHARVELLQGIGSDDIRPIAVRDEANPGCVTVNFVTDDASHTVIKSMTLTQQSNGFWSNPTGDTLPMSAANGSNVIVQPVLGCGTSAVAYDGSTNSGLNYINSYSANSPGSGQAPALTTGGVTLGGSCVPDQYFSTQACTAAVTAHIALAPGIPLSAETIKARDMSTGNTVTLTKLSTQVSGKQTVAAGGLLTVNSTAGFTPTGSIDDNSTNPVTSFAYTAIDATHFKLTNGGTFANNDVITQTGDTSWTSGLSGLAIGVETGQHPIRIDWTQTSGSVGGVPCGNGSNACSGNLGIQQQAFGACNACDPPDDSDGVVGLKLRLQTDPAGISGRNAFARTDTPNLVVELTLSTLRFDTPSPTTPDIILRVGTSTDQATGLIDCGQGNGANADANAITNGCPIYTDPACKNYDFCAPLIAYDASKHPNGVCDPELRQTANPVYSDCVNTISGTRRTKIPGAIASRIIDASGVCSPNNWTAYATNPSTYPIKDDPRAMLFIITKPADLSKNSVVPIETFATFYVTGWDTSGGNPTCNPAPGEPGNDAWPGVGKSKQNGAIWGHWITYTDPNVITNNTFCDPTKFGVCGTVLTR